MLTLSENLARVHFVEKMRSLTCRAVASSGRLTGSVLGVLSKRQDFNLFQSTSNPYEFPHGHYVNDLTLVRAILKIHFYVCVCANPMGDS